MSTTQKPIPALPGWFTPVDGIGEPHLLGTRCLSCGSYFFPREKTACRNPACGAATLEEVPLSRHGTLWSYTNAGYQPPDPFIPARLPFEPFALAAVELSVEKLCILGMVPHGICCADLKVGMQMELVIDTLHEDAEHRYLTWKWRPSALSSTGKSP